MTQLIPVFIFIVVMLSCNKRQESAQQLPGENDIRQTKAAAPVETLTHYTPESSPAGVSAYNILTTGFFHGDEVDKDASRKDWFGLFKREENYYLARTNVSLKRVRDELLDDEGEETGWEVTTDNPDENILLIEAAPVLQERKIQKAEAGTLIYPGDTVTFRYSGIDYRIFATGEKRKVNASYDWFEVSEYKLYIHATIHGEQRKSLLVAHEYFEDSMTSILFAGDIDGDGILDLIIDTTNHYNVVSPTLYFSSSATKGEVVKAVGKHISVGC